MVVSGAMEITVLYFAGCRDITGRARETLELGDGSCVRDALASIRARYPALAARLPVTRVAVNEEFTTEDTALAEGDELVLIPPVSGGSGTRAVLCHEPIDREAATALLETGGAGAIITFAGTVRPTAKTGRAVTHLDYEAYEGMALKKMEICLAEAAQRWPLLDAAVVHRLGHLTLGEVAVSIAVCSKHRKEAFEACAYIIDRLKQIVPIWKKETGPDGEEWVSEGA